MASAVGKQLRRQSDSRQNDGQKNDGQKGYPLRSLQRIEKDSRNTAGMKTAMQEH